MYKCTPSKRRSFLGFKVLDCFPEFFLFRESLSISLRSFLILALVLIGIQLIAACGSRNLLPSRASDTLRQSPDMCYFANFVVVVIELDRIAAQNHDIVEQRSFL